MGLINLPVNGSCLQECLLGIDLNLEVDVSVVQVLHPRTKQYNSLVISEQLTFMIHSEEKLLRRKECRPATTS